MSHLPSCRPLWARLAAWLGFLAVFAALLAPVALLAEDVRTGKLGGLCSLAGGAAIVAAGDFSPDGEFSPATAHCDLCGSTGSGLPSLAWTALFPAPVTVLVAVFPLSVRSASSPGLPFSRAPPAL